MGLATQLARLQQQPVEKIASDFDRDYWMTATEAKDYGLVDEVLITNPKKAKKP
jgi:ATP-dependent Clp protease protease subunit